MPKYLSVNLEVTWLNISYYKNAIVQAEFSDTPHYTQLARDEFAIQIQKEIECWQKNPQFCFSLPLALNGTPFQQKVCKALLDIPGGQARTYGWLADKLNSSPRAIGQACRRNPIVFFVPCHRVIAKTGMGGFMGNVEGALNIKTWLLERENV